MKKKDGNLVWWGISLIVLGVCGLVSVCGGAGWLALPDWLVRVVGILCLLCLPVLAYTTVRKLKGKG
ncbi:MAG: hypothetical protein E7331_06025 [Clostridiales bacterium]|nr:hypothetical protein [Clostridiales bacterium]